MTDLMSGKHGKIASSFPPMAAQRPDVAEIIAEIVARCHAAGWDLALTGNAFVTRIIE
jgi:hypothetical protein